MGPSTFHCRKELHFPISFAVPTPCFDLIAFFTTLALFGIRFFAVLLCGFMVEKCFFCQGTAKTSLSEFVRALIQALLFLPAFLLLLSIWEVASLPILF